MFGGLWFSFFLFFCLWGGGGGGVSKLHLLWQFDEFELLCKSRFVYLSAATIIEMNKLRHRHTALLYVQPTEHFRTWQQPAFQAGDTVAIKGYHVQPGRPSKFGGYKYPASRCTKRETDKSAECREGMQKVWVLEEAIKPRSSHIKHSLVKFLLQHFSSFLFFPIATLNISDARQPRREWLMSHTSLCLLA